jgi:hypothetical protein
MIKSSRYVFRADKIKHCGHLFYEKFCVSSLESFMILWALQDIILYRDGTTNVVLYWKVSQENIFGF